MLWNVQVSQWLSSEIWWTTGGWQLDKSNEERYTVHMAFVTLFSETTVDVVGGCTEKGRVDQGGSEAAIPSVMPCRQGEREFAELHSTIVLDERCFVSRPMQAKEPSRLACLRRTDCFCLDLQRGAFRPAWIRH